MIYYVAAEVVVLVHFLFVVFVVLGALALLRWPKLVWLHLPALTWAVLLELFGWICPLTPLENYFLELAGETTYAGGFISHYIEPILYPAGLTREIQIWLGTSLAVFNLAIYAFAFSKKRAK